MHKVIKIAVATAMLSAAILKCYGEVRSPRVDPGDRAARATAAAVVGFETGFSAWLLTGFLPRPTWLATICCFAIYASTAAYKLFAGEDRCDCFGPLSPHPLVMVVIDLAMLAALVRFPPTRRCQGALDHAGRRGRFMIAASAAVWVAIFSSIFFDNLVISHGIRFYSNREWLGKCCPLLGFISSNSNLYKNEWNLIFFRRTCPTCRRFIEKELLAPSPVPSVFVEITPDRHAEPPEDLKGKEYATFTGTEHWRVEFPQKIHIKDCNVAE